MGWYQHDGKMYHQFQAKQLLKRVDKRNLYKWFSRKPGQYVDYAKGRAIKTDFGTFPELDSTKFNKENGENKMEEIALELESHDITYDIPPAKTKNELKQIMESVNQHLT